MTACYPTPCLLLLDTHPLSGSIILLGPILDTGYLPIYQHKKSAHVPGLLCTAQRRRGVTMRGPVLQHGRAGEIRRMWSLVTNPSAPGDARAGGWNAELADARSMQECKVPWPIVPLRSARRGECEVVSKMAN